MSAVEAIDPGTAALLAALAAQAEQIKALTALVTRQAAAPAPTITIREIFRHFERARSHEHSWITIRNRLLPLVRRLGDTPACDLTVMAWDAHRAARRQERTYLKRPPTEHTLNIELGRARELLSFAVRGRLLPSNPLEGAEYVRTTSKRETWLKECDLQRLLACCSPILRAFVLLAADLGFRFNECRKLRRGWISDGVIELPRQFTKGRKSRRVALTARATAALEAIPHLAPDAQGHDEIFRNPQSGKLYSEVAIRRWFRLACEDSGVDAVAATGEHVVVHSLRHSAAMSAIRRGAALPAVQAMLGHAQLSTTAGYLHRDEREVLRIGRLMDEGTRAEGGEVSP